MSSIEYLKHLREDINKHKIDIEGHIQSINSYDIISPSQLKENKNAAQNRSDIKKLSLSGIHSPKNDQSTMPSLPKISNKYKNVESKVAKHILATPQTKADPSSDTKKKDLKETPNSKKSLSALDKSGSKSYKTPGRDGKTTDRNRNNESEASGKKDNRPLSNFMTAVDAIQFVEKLISDFKANNKM